MGAIKAAIADGVLSFMWVFCFSTLGLLTSLITGFLGLDQTQWIASLFITLSLVFAMLFVFGIIGELLGGATSNPTAKVAFSVAGIDASLSLFAAAIRFPAQAVGSAAGALAIREVMPMKYKDMLEGPSLKVDMHTGAIAEGIFTFAICFLSLIVVVKGPSNPLMKTCLMLVVTIALMITGSSYTGPSMNPANAYGWAYVYDKHNTWEHFYVYWICPFIGAMLAAWIFRAIFPLPATKQKET